MLRELSELAEAGVFADIDVHFARLLSAMGAAREVALAAAAVSAAHRAGHTCLKLDCAGGPIVDIAELAETVERIAGSGTDDGKLEALRRVVLPEAAELRRALENSPVVCDGGTPDNTSAGGEGGEEPRPLVLDGDRLYLHRLHDAECRVAQRLLELAQQPVVEGRAAPRAARRLSGKARRGSISGHIRLRSNDAGQDASPVECHATSTTGCQGEERHQDLESVIEKAFGGQDQRTEEATAAVRAAVERRLSIVTGGPGTGKTTLVARILSALIESGVAAPRRIALAAPTGKAATRLQDSVQGRLDDEDLLARVPRLRDFSVQASTIHRLLASRTSVVDRLQALIVDECSMVDLPLMARLAAKLPPECRLVLLGDANQLSSVEPGSVFSDLCRAGDGERLGACVATLTTNYRFGADSGIGRLARAITGGDGDGALATLRDPDDAATAIEPLSGRTAFDAFARAVADEWAEHMVRLAAQPDDCAAFPARRILCSHRRGPFGASRLNRLVERRLAQLGRRSEHDVHYLGRPVIVVQNDRQTDLANGDAGVVVEGPDGGRRVWFPERDRGDERFHVSTARLPRHESYFALTVHRAQGSEYEEVVFIPGDAESRVNTRELFYTAVTRARRRVVARATEAAIQAAVTRRTARASGLLDRLR